MRLQEGRSRRWLPAALGAGARQAAARLVAPPSYLVEPMKIRQENEERKKLIVRAPLPRRGGVSGLPHRAAATGLDEASVAAPLLSLPMYAADQARSRKQRKERRNPQFDPGNRHNDRTTPCSAETSGLIAESDDSAETRDSVAPLADMALARCRRRLTHSHRTRRTQDELGRVSRLDRTTLVTPESRRLSAGSPTTERSGCLDVHPSLRRKLDRLRCALLGWTANGLRLHVDIRSRVPETLGDGRSLASLDTDPRGSQSARRVRGLRSPRLRALAAHSGALWPEVEVSGREPQSADVRLGSGHPGSSRPGYAVLTPGPVKVW